MTASHRMPLETVEDRGALPSDGAFRAKHGRPLRRRHGSRPHVTAVRHGSIDGGSGDRGWPGAGQAVSLSNRRRSRRSTKELETSSIERRAYRAWLGVSFAIDTAGAGCVGHGRTSGARAAVRGEAETAFDAEFEPAPRATRRSIGGNARCRRPTCSSGWAWQFVPHACVRPGSDVRRRSSSRPGGPHDPR
jgi:hypothetical protein